jgi:hypothetical protein
MATGQSGHRLGPAVDAASGTIAVRAVRHARVRMRDAPLQEVLVPGEHGVDDLVEDVLGGLADEERIGVQRGVGRVVQGVRCRTRRLPRERGLIRDMGNLSFVPSGMHDDDRQRLARHATPPRPGNVRARCGRRPTPLWARTCGNDWTLRRGGGAPPRPGGLSHPGGLTGGSLTPQLHHCHLQTGGTPRRPVAATAVLVAEPTCTPAMTCGAATRRPPQGPVAIVARCRPLQGEEHAPAPLPRPLPP